MNNRTKHMIEVEAEWCDTYVKLRYGSELNYVTTSLAEAKVLGITKPDPPPFKPGDILISRSSTLRIVSNKEGVVGGVFLQDVNEGTTSGFWDWQTLIDGGWKKIGEVTK